MNKTVSRGSICSLSVSAKDLQLAISLAGGQATGSSADKKELNVEDSLTTETSKSWKQTPEQAQRSSAIIEPTLKRYIVLILFCINSGNKAFQWIQICAVTEKVTYYYDVDNFIINGTSVLFLLSFVFLSWPACYLIESIGVRKAVLVASFGTTCGSLIKCFCCYESGIYLLFFAQIMVSFSEQLIFSVPSRLASVWFPDHQVSSALAVSVLGNQLGVALGFVIPQYFLSKMESKEEIGLGLYHMFVATAALSVFAFLASFALFDEAPKHPPGAARLRQIEIERQLKILAGTQAKKSVFKEIKTLLGQVFGLLEDKHLALLTLSFGINNGICYTVSTILNQMLQPLWPGEEIFVGNTGFLIIISGTLCSLFWGKLLDKLHQYLWINILLTLSEIASLIIFAYVVSRMQSKLLIYISAILFGSFQTGFVIAGLEFAVELTYPAPELITSSLLNVSPQIFGTVFIFVSSYLVDNFGAVASNIFFVGCLTVSLVMQLNIKETLKRQNAVMEKEKKKSLSNSIKV